jgi:hypothetical protein
MTRIASFLLPALVLTACGSSQSPWMAERKYPPLVFTSQAYLDCSISSTQPGRQAMTTTSGQGFSFETPMKPIATSKLKVAGTGMNYKFDAYPTATFPAKFTGLGDGTVVEMKAEVEVDVKRYQQPGGSGTDITFDAADINADGAYVEFTGVWVRSSDSKRFPFRVLFSKVSDGGGRVTPATPEPDTHIMAKAVMIGTPKMPATVTTSLYEDESSVETLAAH